MNKDEMLAQFTAFVDDFFVAGAQPAGIFVQVVLHRAGAQPVDSWELVMQVQQALKEKNT